MRVFDTIIAILNLSLLLVIAGLAIGFCSGCEPEDLGRLHNDAGEPLRPAVLPWIVAQDGSLPQEALDRAVGYWHSQACHGLFQGAAGGLYDRIWAESPYGSARWGVVLVSERYPVEVDDDPDDLVGPLGSARLFWRGAEVVSVEVSVSPAVRDLQEWQVAVLVHELGHALGLADDNRYATSAMAEVLDPGRPITDGDVERVCEEE